MGWKLVGILLGEKIEELANTTLAFGADEIWLGMHPLLEPFTIEAYTKVLHEAVLSGKPSVLLMGATPNGRDLAGRLAVRLRTGLNADCTGLEIERDNGVLVCEVSGFGGGVLALIEMGLHRPQMATVRPGVFGKPEANNNSKGVVIELPVSLEGDEINTRVLEKVSGQGVDISQAQVILAGGRGVEGDFGMLADLADLLPGAEVGATRPPVDDGFIERERQIGQTGVVCSPKVAICCGISGAFHFIVGVEKADIVIAMNSDPEAEIFQHADYCILGDVSEILPKISAFLQTSMEVAGA
jgi:electron transfer flavoprotein alpha subunit